MQLSELSPACVWKHFEQITRIPRPSGHEEQIVSYLETFARQRQLQFQRDAAGNLVIRKPAHHSDSSRIIALQSHVDMVCEKNGDTEFDFLQDAIQTYIEDGWVKAKNTTLGADCGIGMAVQLALLDDTESVHPALECLFTINEETGLTGAYGLGKDMLKADYLVNLDSEDEGEIFIGCAGGIDTIGTFSYKTCTCRPNSRTVHIAIRGLRGGHSGDDIDKNLANANVLMTRILMCLQSNIPLQLLSFDGGNLRNAIPREAVVCLAAPCDAQLKIADTVQEAEKIFRQEYHATEPALSVSVVFGHAPEEDAIEDSVFANLLKSLYTLPNGVTAMSQDIPGFVETSTNLASVKTSDQTVIVSTSQRSSVESKKTELSRVIRTVFETYGATVRHSNDYPGWTPVPDSFLLNVFADSYRRLFGKEVRVKTVHAGLECGLFLEKYPRLEMVSIGPTIRQVHSPEEKLEIDSVVMFWQWLLETLQRL